MDMDTEDRIGYDTNSRWGLPQSGSKKKEHGNGNGNGNGNSTSIDTECDGLRARPYDPKTAPDHMLSFEDIVYRGYNTDDERNETVAVSIYTYPLALYNAYKYVIHHTEDGRLRYISDVQRFSTKLGFAILTNSEEYTRLHETYKLACDHENLFVQYGLETVGKYPFATDIMERKRNIKTLYYIHDESEVMSNILSTHQSSVMILMSILGLERSRLPDRLKKPLGLEHARLKDWVEFKWKGLVNWTAKHS